MKFKHILFIFCIIPFGSSLATEPEADDVFTPPEHEDQAYSYLTYAYDILEVFQSHPWIGQEHSARLQVIINRLRDNPSPQILQTVHHVLRCYNALANACPENPTDATFTPTLKQEILLDLLDQRAALTKEIAEAAYPSAIATLIMHNLKAYLNHEPTAQEREALSQQHARVLAAKEEKIKVLNKKLFEIEKELLKDRRTLAQRYGPSLAVIAGVICTGLLISKTLNALHRKKPAKTKPVSLRLPT